MKFNFKIEDLKEQANFNISRMCVAFGFGLIVFSFVAPSPNLITANMGIFGLFLILFTMLLSMLIGNENIDKDLEMKIEVFTQHFKPLIEEINREGVVFIKERYIIDRFSGEIEVKSFLLHNLEYLPKTTSKTHNTSKLSLMGMAQGMYIPVHSTETITTTETIYLEEVLELVDYKHKTQYIKKYNEFKDSFNEKYNNNIEDNT